MQPQVSAFILLALAAAAYVHAAPAESTFANRFPSLPFKHTQISTNGFPMNEKGESFHLIQQGVDQSPVWLSESQVWDIEKTQRRFMDVTFHPDMMEKANTLHRAQKLNSLSKDIQRFARNSPVVLSHKDQVASIVDSCNTTLMKTTLEKMWLLSKVQEVASNAKPGIDVKVIEFKHPFIQSSVIARIEGQQNQEETVIIGAHLDSTNSKDHAGRAPGADDDGSGTVSSFEAFRALIDSGFKPKRPIEFHWYAGEEGGLLGSQDVAYSYQQANRKVAGMLQLDITGRPFKDRPNEIGIINDYVDPNLTITLKEIVKQYLPDVTTKDGWCYYGCSDHYSWNQTGYPAARSFESAKASYNTDMHTTEDTIDKVNFDHALRFTKIAVVFAAELSLE
ncbi:hypothetical protein BDF19DRAFT_447909 [Syncephalis fuscata]|nr:hypothetical protein BDF19DRAFT_447909 [Syncephalis fuscata]